MPGNSSVVEKLSKEQMKQLWCPKWKVKIQLVHVACARAIEVVAVVGELTAL